MSSHRRLSLAMQTKCAHKTSVGRLKCLVLVTGIEPAFSAWEIDSGGFLTCVVR